jgi:hypothetical protein
MAVKQVVSTALNTPMSRRQFILQLGAVFVALIGLSAVMDSLRRLEGHHAQTAQPSSVNGYGATPYGH